jgi:uncharacterized membrane protein YgcG
MKTLIAITFLLFSILFVSAQDYPTSVGYVNDFYHMLSPEQNLKLNNELITFEKKTSIEIAVVTVEWANEEDPETYARHIGDLWGVGKRGSDNGILLLIDYLDRKIVIITGKGMKGVLTPTISQEIINNTISPELHSGNYAEGIINGTHEIMMAATGQPIGTVADIKRFAAANKLWLMIGAGIAFILILRFPFYLHTRNKRVFFKKQSKIQDELANILLLIKKPDTAPGSEEYFSKLKKRFENFSLITQHSNVKNWRKYRQQISKLHDDLVELKEHMEEYNENAVSAREEAQELYHDLPAMFEKTQKDLDDEEAPPKAYKRLERAKKKYREAEEMHLANTSNPNWLLMYEMLNVSRNHYDSAVDYNSDASSYTSSASSILTSNVSSGITSGGFGNSGGFGGGGFSGGGSASGGF